jgi:hypothetical protein
VPPDYIERMRALLQRLDELCREAAEIREEVERVSRGRASWPDDRRVSRVFTRSDPPSEIGPTSANDVKKKN